MYNRCGLIVKQLVLLRPHVQNNMSGDVVEIHIAISCTYRDIVRPVAFEMYSRVRFTEWSESCRVEFQYVDAG